MGLFLFDYNQAEGFRGRGGLDLWEPHEGRCLVPWLVHEAGTGQLACLWI